MVHPNLPIIPSARPIGHSPVFPFLASGLRPLDGFLELAFLFVGRVRHALARLPSWPARLFHRLG